VPEGKEVKNTMFESFRFYYVPKTLITKEFAAKKKVYRSMHEALYKL